MTESTSAADVMAGFLSASGVSTMFGYPGDSNIELMERARQRGVDTVLATREATAAFMAQGSAMTSGGLGVCLSTLGPGSTALVNGVAAANLDRVPMLAISGQINSAREPYFTHQVVDHKGLFSSVTKWAGRMEAGSAATVMRKALRVATAERPGAVHLTVNSDVAKAEATDHVVAPPPSEPDAMANVVHRRADGADPVALLSQARRPVILAGIGALRQQAGPSITALAELANMPIVTAGMAKGVVSEDHPCFAGVLEMACSKVVYGLLREADLILAVGFDPVELFPAWTLQAPVIHIDTTPNTDQVYPSPVEIVGSIPAAMRWLAADYEGGQRWTGPELDAHRRRLRDGYYEGRVDGRLNPTDVVDVLRAQSPRDAIVTTDVGSHKLLIGQGWTTYEPRTALMTNGLSSMGFGLPAAIGAKLARPDRHVVAAIGDGGFAMVQAELRLAAALRLGMVVLVFSDQSLNRIELKQIKLGYPSTATRIERTDLAATAEAMDCHGAWSTAWRRWRRS